MDHGAESFLVIDVDSGADPGGEKLQALLQARFAYERARELRVHWFKLVVFLLACVLAGSAIQFSPLEAHWAATLAVSAALLARVIVALGIEAHRFRRWVELGRVSRGLQVRGN